MPLSIYSNLASVDAQLRLGRAQEMVGRNMAQLASGLRIANVSDDPAGVGIATQFDTHVRSFQQAARNTNDGLSLLQTVDGSLSQIHGVLQRMRELAVQSSNGTLGTADRTNLATEFTQLQSEINRIGGSTKFGNIQLLNADSTVQLQVGINNNVNDQVSVTVRQQDTTVMKVDTIKIDTQAASTTALDSIDTAIARISTDRATLGAAQNRLSIALNNDNAFAQNLSAALGRIRDVDVAAASAELARNQVLTQAGIAVLAQANVAPNQALSLLRG